ncbi:MAG: hypothetical protein ACLT2Z_02805 [Eubacterium sp.]
MKKPFFVVVSVIIILLIGVVSLKHEYGSYADMNIPYDGYYYRTGASPQKVESDVTKPLEVHWEQLAEGKIVSDLLTTIVWYYGACRWHKYDSALVRVSKVDNAEIPDECGNQ